MNIGEYSVEKKVVSWLLVIIMVAGGITGFQSMGKLEDPSFTIKEAKIITYYPGATAREVQDEVTYHIEEALQQMEQLRRIKMSISRPGVSDLSVEFKEKYTSEAFPNIYDELRRKIADMKHKLPPGAQAPIIVDDYSDVFGVYLALTGEGYTYRDLKDVADFLKKDLVLLDGVRKINISGDQQEVVYLEFSTSRLNELAIPLEQIGSILKTQNLVSDAGRVRVGDEYIRIEPTGEFQSVQEIGDLLISSKDKKLVYLRDIATIHRSYEEIPGKLIYFNGQPALTLGISMQKGMNVVAIGGEILHRLDQLQSSIPVGMELHSIYNQPVEVDNSVAGFMVNVGQALAIVVAVLLVFMGVRSGLIIGAVLLITVAGTLWIMEMFGIELQRISLGAMVIALGMLVDNAIVICEGMLVRMQGGMKGGAAARDVVSKSMWALLGGTVIGILAFSAIGLSSNNTGEFTRSLFYVILISLMLSWVTAVSTTPLLCALLIKPKKQGDGGADPYGGKFFVIYRGMVAKAIRFRWITVGLVVGLFALSIVCFSFVRQSFFPDSNTPMFFVDIWEVEGADIRKTRDDALKIEAFIRQQPGVVKTTTVVGGGDMRFSLVFSPKEASSSYAQIIVQTEQRDQIPAVWDAVDHYMQGMPDIDPIIKALRIGPGRDSKIEARFSGPDSMVLRDIVDRANKIFRDSGAKEVRGDWRQPVKMLRPVFNEQVGRQLGVTRADLAKSLKASFEGLSIGLYRDGIRLLPLKARLPEEERQDVGNLQDMLVYSPVLKRSIPIAQVVTRFETVWEETVIRGRNRQQTMIASANPSDGMTNELFAKVRPLVEAIDLPPGYSLAWGGEYEDSTDAQKGVAKALPAGFLFMIIVTILLFGKIRQPLIIWLTVPLAAIGVTWGLLGLNGAFDFMSLLGALSLIGLLIKNAIVLIEEIDQQIDEGKDHYTAILDSAVSRMRPVMMAAATTILGMIPLLQDVFFINMSITIMGGLGFATVLTLIFVPVLYALFFKVPTPAERT